jgi:hypothetical protein
LEPRTVFASHARHQELVIATRIVGRRLPDCFGGARVALQCLGGAVFAASAAAAVVAIPLAFHLLRSKP